MSVQKLVAARKGIASTSMANDVIEDSAMAMFCESHWGELLQPAPLSIALLGSMTVIASSIDDFRLLSDTPAGAPVLQLTYAQSPESFKACLQQMVANGYEAFEGAYQNMTKIYDRAAAIRSSIRNSVQCIVECSGREIELLIPSQIDSIVGYATESRRAGAEVEQSFKKMQGLAIELFLAATSKIKGVEGALDMNKLQLEILKLERENEEQQVADSKKRTESFQKSLDRAERAFDDAAKGQPFGWELAGMSTVEALTNLMVTAGNAFVSQSTIRSQMAMQGMSVLTGQLGGTSSTALASTLAADDATATTSPLGVSTQPTAANANDLAVSLVAPVLSLVTQLKLLISGAEGSKPEWDKIRETGGKSGPKYISGQLNSFIKELSPEGNTSKLLRTYIATGVKISAAVAKAGDDAGRNDATLKPQVAPVDQLIGQLTALQSSVNFIAQQPGAISTGLDTPEVPSSTTESMAKLALEFARGQVDLTRSQLETQRTMMNKTTDRLVTEQGLLLKSIAAMAQLDLANTSLPKILPLLKSAAGAFAALRAQFSTIVSLFDSVAVLLKDCLRPRVGRWTDTISAAEMHRDSTTLGGVTASAYFRDLLYRILVQPQKVVVLSSQVVIAYSKISDSFIMPAQRNLALMLELVQIESDAPKDVLLAKLSRTQSQISAQAKDASDLITEMTRERQREFVKHVETRLDAITSSLKAVMPEVTQPVPAQIKAIGDAHAFDFAVRKEAIARSNPMFDRDALDDAIKKNWA